MFSKQRKHQIILPSIDESGKPANLGFLVRFLCERVMKDTRKEMFVLDGTVYVDSFQVSDTLSNDTH